MEREIPDYLSHRQFSNLSKEAQTSYIRKLVSDDDTLKKMLQGGHTERLHVAGSENELLARTVSDCKDRSSFESFEAALHFIREALYYDAGHIANWLNGSNNDSRPVYKTVVNIGDKVGSGINTYLNAVETNTVGIAVSKNYAVGVEPLIYIKSAYPELRNVEIHSTGKNFSVEAEQLLKQETDPTVLGFWALRSKGFETEFHTGRNGPAAFTPFYIEDRKFLSVCNENSVIYSRPAVSMVVPNSDGSFAYIPLHKLPEEYCPDNIKQAAYAEAAALENVFLAHDLRDLTNVRQTDEAENSIDKQQKSPEER